MIYSLGDKQLNRDNLDFWVAPNAAIIGDVTIKKNASVWFGAILRGEEVIIPRSNFIFKKEDIVVLLAKKDFLNVVENMFRISSI